MADLQPWIYDTMI